MVNDNISVIGSWIKFALSLDLPGSLSMDDVGFEAVFDTSRLGTHGRIKCQVRVDIPDANVESGVRTEIIRIDTDEIVRNGVL